MNQVEGVHWHGYVRVAAEQTTPTPNDRAIRLAAEPETVLTSPDAVGTWVTRRIRGRGDRLELWLPVAGQWMTYRDSDTSPQCPTLETECTLRAAQSRSVYAAVWSSSATAPAPRYEVYAEAVTRQECPVRGDHLDGRRQR